MIFSRGGWGIIKILCTRRAKLNYPPLWQKSFPPPGISCNYFGHFYVKIRTCSMFIGGSGKYGVTFTTFTCGAAGKYFQNSNKTNYTLPLSIVTWTTSFQYSREGEVPPIFQGGDVPPPPIKPPAHFTLTTSGDLGFDFATSDLLLEGLFSFFPLLDGAGSSCSSSSSPDSRREKISEFPTDYLN